MFIVKLLKLESAKDVTTPSVKKRMEEVLMTSRGSESSVIVAGQTGSVILNKGIGERHAETDVTIDDQSEALWTVFEETSTTCTVVRRTDIHCRRSTTGRVW